MNEKDIPTLDPQTFAAQVDALVKQVIETEPTNWIPWAGGDCPVDGTVDVQVRLRGGVELPIMPARKLPVEWHHWKDIVEGEDCEDDDISYSTMIYRLDDIIAYRII